MASDELKIRAMDGSALVVGRFALSGRSPQATALVSIKPGDLIGFSLPRDTSRRPAIRLHSDWRRADDGLYAAGPPAASVEFGDAMLNLPGLASSMFGDGVKKVFLRGDGAHLLTVRFLPVGTENALPVYGHIQEVTIEVARRKEGLLIRIDGPVQPFALEKDGPLLEDVHFDCEVVLPPAFCQLSSLGHYYGAGGQQTEWRADLSGLAATPICSATITESDRRQL